MSEIKKKEKEGNIVIKTPYQLESIEGDENIKSISLKFDDGKKEKINTDILLGFFGLIMKLGPIAEWGLNMDKKTIEVNSEKFRNKQKRNICCWGYLFLSWKIKINFVRISRSSSSICGMF